MKLRDEPDAQTWMEGREIGIATRKKFSPSNGCKDASLIYG